ncbi:MAG: hypothetical protein GYB65_03815 [Chloroflexi bacterium]|nr:hypothetical protein [Chloroflexota bacterium]
MSRYGLALPALALLIIGAVLVLHPLRSSAQGDLPPAQTGRIAFVSTRDGNPELYVMAADGSNPVRLTDGPLADNQAAWSPDGTQLVYVTEIAPGQSDLAIVDISTGTTTPLTALGAQVVHPAWSPDGARIAFASDASGDMEIYTINTDGTGLTNLTENPATDESPTWAPDSGRLAFQSDRDGDTELYVMAADGTNPARLTTSPGADRNPVWSPDGMRIAFLSERNNNSDIFVVDHNGTNLVQLSSTRYDDRNPAWSPDGVLIAYVEGIQPDVSELVTINADGFDRIQRTLLTAQITQPDWSLDGAWIALAADQDGSSDLLVLQVATNSLLPLTAMPGVENTAPLWSAGDTSQAVLPPPAAATPSGASGETGQEGAGLPAIPTATMGIPTATQSLPTPEPPTATPQAPPTLPPPTRPPPTLEPPTSEPPTNTPQAVIAQPDLLLIYDGALPYFELVNTSGTELDLTGLVFEGNGIRVESSIWERSGALTSSLSSFARDDCLGLWGINIGFQPPPAECVTRHSWWSSNNVLFWTSGTFTVYYNGRAVAVCETEAGRCLVSFAATISDPPPAAPPPQAPAPATTGNNDVLLVYDAGLPSFFLVNTAGRAINLAPLSFEGNNKRITPAIWTQGGMSGSLTDFPADGCVGLWGLGIPVQPRPPECGFRHGWWESDNVVFWTAGTFAVTYGGTPLVTCDSNAARCGFDLP